jgi:hypothetical protein
MSRFKEYRRQIKHLREAIIQLYKAIESMKESNDFNTLDSGVTFEGNPLPTYEETIYHLINGIKEKIVELEHDIPHIKKLMAKHDEPPDYDDGGESAYLDAMEKRISRVETSFEPDTHFDTGPADPERPVTFMGKTGYLATCELCGLVVMLDSNQYSYSDSLDWTCQKSSDEQMMEACRQKQAADDGTSDQAFDAWREGQAGRTRGRD